MFWTKDAESINAYLELTLEHRCKDEWLSYFLLKARHGNKEHELYCFMHGLPTRNPGSWHPRSGQVECNREKCKKLGDAWKNALLAGQAKPWTEGVMEECQTCREERDRRCRVWKSGRQQAIKFADAPLIHPWNEPKYHAAILRAQHYARRTQRILIFDQI